MYGICVVYAWHMLGMCKEYAWDMHGICTIYIYIYIYTQGMCIEYTWSENETSLEYTNAGFPTAPQIGQGSPGASNAPECLTNA